MDKLKEKIIKLAFADLAEIHEFDLNSLAEAIAEDLATEFETKIGSFEFENLDARNQLLFYFYDRIDEAITIDVAQNLEAEWNEEYAPSEEDDDDMAYEKEFERNYNNGWN